VESYDRFGTMGKRYVIPAVVSVILLFLPPWGPFRILAQPAPVKSPRTGIRSAPGSGPAFAQENIILLRRTALRLRTLAAETPPGSSGVGDRRDANDYSNWLGKASRELDDLAGRWQADLSASMRSAARPGSLEAMNASYRMKLLALQKKLQEENRKFALVSNIMKTKHEAAKAAISNIR